MSIPRATSAPSTAAGEDVVNALKRIVWEHPDREAQSEAVETLADALGDAAVPELAARGAPAPRRERARGRRATRWARTRSTTRSTRTTDAGDESEDHGDTAEDG
jgi:hypothetical protein